MRRGRVWVRCVIACLLPVVVGACTAMPRDASLPVNDPNEDANRQVLAMNQKMLVPAAEVVKAVTPGPVHDRLHDINSNLKEPRIFVNNVLQLRFDAAAYTAARFAMNTTFGLGGLVDLATREGLPQQSGDFGQTLFVWGVAEGPYMMRPYWGPTTTRDAVGATVDLFADPVGLMFGTQLGVAITTASLDTLVRLGQFKQAEDASIDFYSFLRSSYYQTRRAELREAVGLPNEIESPATALDETGNSAQAKSASASASHPLSGEANSVLRSNTKQKGRAVPEPTRVLALSAR
jgi:phospholipid-binding lipoprotein MlaA